MNTLDFPISSLLLISMPTAALLIWLTPDPSKARWIALVTTLVDMLLVILLLVNFDTSVTGYQFVEQATWIPWGFWISPRLPVNTGSACLDPGIRI